MTDALSCSLANSLKKSPGGNDQDLANLKNIQTNTMHRKGHMTYCVEGSTRTEFQFNLVRYYYRVCTVQSYKYCIVEDVNDH